MASYRNYKTFKGFCLPDSPFTLGSNTYTTFLTDTNISFSSYFPLLDTEESAVPPYSTSGLVIDRTFICRTPFDKKIRMEGPIDGNIILKLGSGVSDTSASMVVITGVYITLYAIAPDGTSTTLLSSCTVFPKFAGSTIRLYGYGTVQNETKGMYFTGVINATAEAGTRLAMQVKTYGYMTRSGSTTYKHYLDYDMSSSDLMINLPVTGV